ncbi:MAG: sugar phosphate nucleotidyltransferase [Solirubrobacterales bacterium]
MILAGGAGTRMRPLTEGMPKALIPVLGRPFADWQLELLAERGLRRVLYSVGYRGEMIRDHVGDGDRWGLEVDYVDEGEELRGTAGALRVALDQGVLEPDFFVLYGDSYLPVDLGAVESAWRRTELPALMTVFRNEDRWDESNAIYDDGRVTVYDKSRPADRVAEMHWIDYGLSILTLEPIAERVPPEGVTDLADLMRELSRDGMLAGHEVSQRFYEAGSREGLRDLERYLRRRSP